MSGEEDNVVRFTGDTRLPIPVDWVLDGAPRDMQTAVIVGYDAKGEFYFASSESATPKIAWLLDQAKFQLLGAGIQLFELTPTPEEG